MVSFNKSQRKSLFGALKEVSYGLDTGDYMSLLDNKTGLSDAIWVKGKSFFDNLLNDEIKNIDEISLAEFLNSLDFNFIQNLSDRNNLVEEIYEKIFSNESMYKWLLENIFNCDKNAYRLPNFLMQLNPVVYTALSGSIKKKTTMVALCPTFKQKQSLIHVRSLIDNLRSINDQNQRSNNLAAITANKHLQIIGAGVDVSSVLALLDDKKARFAFIKSIEGKGLKHIMKNANGWDIAMILKLLDPKDYGEFFTIIGNAALNVIDDLDSFLDILQKLNKTQHKIQQNRIFDCLQPNLPQIIKISSSKKLFKLCVDILMILDEDQSVDFLEAIKKSGRLSDILCDNKMLVEFLGVFKYIEMKSVLDATTAKVNDSTAIGGNPEKDFSIASLATLSYSERTKFFRSNMGNSMEKSIQSNSDVFDNETGEEFSADFSRILKYKSGCKFCEIIGADKLQKNNNNYDKRLDEMSKNSDDDLPKIGLNELQEKIYKECATKKILDDIKDMYQFAGVLGVLTPEQQIALFNLVIENPVILGEIIKNTDYSVDEFWPMILRVLPKDQHAKFVEAIARSMRDEKVLIGFLGTHSGALEYKARVKFCRSVLELKLNDLQKIIYKQNAAANMDYVVNNINDGYQLAGVLRLLFPDMLISDDSAAKRQGELFNKISGKILDIIRNNDHFVDVLWALFQNWSVASLFIEALDNSLKGLAKSEDSLSVTRQWSEFINNGYDFARVLDAVCCGLDVGNSVSINSSVSIKIKEVSYFFWTNKNFEYVKNQLYDDINKVIKSFCEKLAEQSSPLHDASPIKAAEALLDNICGIIDSKTKCRVKDTLLMEELKKNKPLYKILNICLNPGIWKKMDMNMRKQDIQESVDYVEEQIKKLYGASTETISDSPYSQMIFEKF